MSDLYGDLWRAESRSRVGNRHVCVTYLTRPATTKNAEDRLELGIIQTELDVLCLLYTSPSPRDRTRSRMPSSA